MKAQGATEYLVLLAVVLIVALVSVALLGFFPGMASDSQIAQSQAYWRSATPIAIIETDAAMSASTGYTAPYLRVRNTGAYPIRITKILGNGQNISLFWYSTVGVKNISDYFYLGPGEENYFAYTAYAPGVPENHGFVLLVGSSGSSDRYLYAASSVCQNSTSAPGTIFTNSFGFEYISYIDGQQITKQEIGKSIIIKCGPPI